MLAWINLAIHQGGAEEGEEGKCCLNNMESMGRSALWCSFVAKVLSVRNQSRDRLWRREKGTVSEVRLYLPAFNLKKGSLALTSWKPSCLAITAVLTNLFFPLSPSPFPTGVYAYSLEKVKRKGSSQQDERVNHCLQASSSRPRAVK